jgi:hypothetical protein
MQSFGLNDFLFMQERALLQVLWLKSPSSEVWLDRRTNYTRSLAVMSMVGYILGLGDRHPSNLMLDRYSGKILHIDFGDCFEACLPTTCAFKIQRFTNLSTHLGQQKARLLCALLSVLAVLFVHLLCETNRMPFSGGSALRVLHPFLTAARSGMMPVTAVRNARYLNRGAGIVSAGGYAPREVSRESSVPPDAHAGQRHGGATNAIVTLSSMQFLLVSSIRFHRSCSPYVKTWASYTW